MIIMWPKKKIYVTLPSQFYHFVTKAFLEISTKLLHKFPFYGWSQSDEKVMEMWQVQISTHFLALHIWKFPPWKNSFIFDGKILMWEIDGFVNAANGRRTSVEGRSVSFLSSIDLTLPASPRTGLHPGRRWVRTEQIRWLQKAPKVA